MTVPTTRISLMKTVYKDILPQVKIELTYWKDMAKKIPSDKLREQALNSIKTKDFHSQGGAILALLAGENKNDCLKFIVAYQTMSDYLDNLCDRDNALNADDFRALHEAMLHAISNKVPERQDYYRYRFDRDDGGYLSSLVGVCQDVLAHEHIEQPIIDTMYKLASIYCDLQIYKHIDLDLREQELKKWFTRYSDKFPLFEWFEFSACAGSTLGIFCLAGYALGHKLTNEQISSIYNAYFPYVQGAHIMFDYFIDQEEDCLEDDLNFCSYYRTNEQLYERLLYFFHTASERVSTMPDAAFHQLLVDAIMGVYLADRKVAAQEDIKKMAKQLLKSVNGGVKFFYRNRKIYQFLKIFSWQK